MYEITYILNPNLSEEEVKTQAEKVRGFIVALGGQAREEKIGEKRKLAYEIEKQNFGYYITIEMLLDPEKVKELNNQLRLENSVLRHLLVIKEKEEPAPIRTPRIAKPSVSPEETPETAPKPEKEEKAKIEEIDKKLEEILEQ